MLDDANLGMESVNTVLEEYGLKKLGSIDEYRSVFGFPIIDYYKKIGLDASIAPFEILAQKYMNHYQPRSYASDLTPTMMEALKLAKECGYKQYILSASRIDLLLKQVEQYPIHSYIEQVYGINDIYAHSKKELAYRVIQPWNKQDQIYMIGDSIHDYEVAQGLGVCSLLVASGHQSKERLLTCRVPVFENAIECVRYIYERTNHSSQRCESAS